MPSQEQSTVEQQHTFPPPFPQPLPITAAGTPPPVHDRTPDEERYGLDEARVVLRELGAVLGYARDRIEDTAFRLPRSEDREAILRFQRPYDVSTELWQVSPRFRSTSLYLSLPGGPRPMKGESRRRSDTTL